MDVFAYRGGTLCAEDVDVAAVARTVETPFYLYSRAAFEGRFRALDRAFGDHPHLVCYAMKANSNQAILRLLARLGAGMDIVSEGELRRARAAGVPGERIVFSGVAKTAREIALALDENVLCFNVESEPELRRISALAAARERTARISIRVNPDVEAGGHRKITTGTHADKFGIPIAEAPRVYAEAAALPGLKVTGIDMHIGSQIVDLAPFAKASRLVADLARHLMGQGHALSHIDVGGGLGVAYRTDNAPPPSADAYAATILGETRSLGLKVICEPGRWLAANSGILVARVVYVKEGAGKTFVIVDAAMNDLIRPTLYDAHHEIVPVREAGADAPWFTADVVGPVCESGDFLAQERNLPVVREGDLIAVRSAGAYGAVQAGTYNSRLLVPEVLADGARWAVVRPRQDYEDLIGLDRVPDWFAAEAVA